MTVIQNEVLDEKTAKKDPQPGIQERSGRADHGAISTSKLIERLNNRTH